jgi:hypothetical protein
MALRWTFCPVGCANLESDESESLVGRVVCHVRVGPKVGRAGGDAQRFVLGKPDVNAVLVFEADSAAE